MVCLLSNNLWTHLFVPSLTSPTFLLSNKNKNKKSIDVVEENVRINIIIEINWIQRSRKRRKKTVYFIVLPYATFVPNFTEKLFISLRIWWARTRYMKAIKISSHLPIKFVGNFIIWKMLNALIKMVDNRKRAAILLSECNKNFCKVTLYRKTDYDLVCLQ